ncbi:NlpC/P60 family protein [Peptoniphilus harei]|uniref:C40 family peptidase n=1 Tax=Peptoniphilus harei TaxID=54005 RepID=UPI0029044F65|nr:NlpC/P60 family protein [Peptoniphilus harei]MDU1642780.1 NlpC/P60 family protein [Peptoniphilus harei]
MKKTLILLGLLLSLIIPTNIFAEKAMPNNSSKMDIIAENGDVSNYTFSTYIIKDYNYFKLRDFASYMNGTIKNFDVDYNRDKDAIEITTKTSYGDFTGLPSDNIVGAKEAVTTKQKIFIDGKEVQISGYNIDGNNYFKLRDLASALDIKIYYDSLRESVILNPNLPSDEKLVEDLNKEIDKLIGMEEEASRPKANTGTSELIGAEENLIYLPPKNIDRKINLKTGYAAEIRNSKIQNFKKISSQVNIPKGTGLLYFDIDNLKTKTIYIDGNDTNISQAYLNKWMKKNILVPLIRGEKISGQEDAYKVAYVTFVDTAPKVNGVSELVSVKANEVRSFLYGPQTNLKDFTADRGQIYSLAKKGENIGWSWWYFTGPNSYNEKIDHMINYALSVQGFSYDQFDCSGLVGTAAEFAGFPLAPAYSWLIEGSPMVQEIPMNQLRRGDLLNKAGEHIMIYIGDGKVVESVPRTGVRVAPVRKAGYKALRIKNV